MKKVYIAGMITGNPNFMEDFQKVEDALTAQGYTVINPAKLPKGLTQADYMQICFSEINSSEIVAMLDNWKNSEGALIEKLYGKKTGKLVIMASKLIEGVVEDE